MSDQILIIIFGMIFVVFQIIYALLKGRKDVKFERDIAEIKSIVKEELNKLEQLYSWHNKSDDDGRLQWYLPHSWIDIQRDIADTCQSSLKILEKLEDKLK